MASPRLCSTKADFDAALQAAGKKLVVVDFTASWCGPCRMIAPVFEELARKYTGSIFLKVDVEENKDVARAFLVSAMPTFVFIRGRNTVDELRGANFAKLRALVEKHSSETGASDNAFSGRGNTLSGSSSQRGSQLASRRNPLHEDESEDEEGQVGELDPDVQAFLDSQQAKRARDEEGERMREERMRSGGVKSTKSRYQRDKEEEERKKAEQEQEAAQAYEEFAAAMAGEALVSQGSAGSAAFHHNLGFVSAGGSSTYHPARSRPPTRTGSSDHSRNSRLGPSVSPSLAACKPGAIFGEDDEGDGDSTSFQTKIKRDVPTKKSGAMTSFLGEIQRKQAAQEKRYRDEIAGGKSVSSILALEGQRIGSRDTGDPLTTNVCVLNLPADISEKSLAEFFGQWGDIGTVKIMWPRGDESVGGAGAGITLFRNTKSAGLTGFVCFMNREDAESALREADGISWGGSVLHTSWGKSMPRPVKPFYSAPTVSYSTRRAKSSSHAEQSPMIGGLKRSRSDASPSAPVSQRRRRNSRSPSPRSRLQQEMVHSETAKTIRAVAERIKAYGPAFEKLIREKEEHNPSFNWLRCDDLPEARYFRMLMDDGYVPEIQAKPFDDAGDASLYETDSGEESETQRLKKQRKSDALGMRARKRFEAMLRGITPRRERIAMAMAFAIQHAHAADTITDIITQSLLIPSTPVPRKLARLYVVSDLLHNSAAPLPNVWKYRSALESRVAVVFRHLGDIARCFPGLMKQEGFKTQVRAVLDVWDSWIVFAPSILDSLRLALEEGNCFPSAGLGFDGDERKEVAEVQIEDEKAPAPSQTGVADSTNSRQTVVSPSTVGVVRTPAFAPSGIDGRSDDGMNDDGDDDVDGDAL